MTACTHPDHRLVIDLGVGPFCGDCGEDMKPAQFRAYCQRVVDSGGEADPSSWPTEPPSEPGWYWMASLHVATLEVVAIEVVKVELSNFVRSKNGTPRLVVLRAGNEEQFVEPCDLSAVRWRPGAIRP